MQRVEMDTSPHKKEVTFSPVVPHCLVSHAEDAILHQEQKGSAHQPEIQSVIDVHMGKATFLNFMG